MAKVSNLHRTSSALAFVIATLFVVSQWLVQSTFANLGGPPLMTLAVLLTTLAVMAGATMALAQGQLLSVTVMGAMFALMAMQCQLFSSLTGAAVNWNALFGLLNIVAFPIFSVRTMPLNRVMAMTFGVALLYCLLYILFFDQFVASADAAREAALRVKGTAAAMVETPGVRVLPGDSARDPRVALAGAFSTFAFFYALVRWRTRGGLGWLLGMLPPATAIWMSHSRTYTGVIILVSAAYLLRLTRHAQRLLFASVFVLAAVFIVSGVPFENWNPFGLTARDESGAVRARAYEIVSNLIRDHFLFGVGIAPSTEAQSAYIGVPSVYWSDLGALGVWYTFGLLGLLLYCSEVAIMMIGVNRPSEMSIANHRTLLLCGLVVGLTAFLSPDMWGGGNGVIAAIAIGIFLRQARPVSLVTSFWFGAEKLLFGAASRARWQLLSRWLPGDRSKQIPPDHLHPNPPAK